MGGMNAAVCIVCVCETSTSCDVYEDTRGGANVYAMLYFIQDYIPPPSFEAQLCFGNGCGNSHPNHEQMQAIRQFACSMLADKADTVPQ